MFLPVPMIAPGINGAEGPTEKPRAPGPKTPPKPVPVVQKTWIEIELLDAKGKPVPNERYRIETPDGVFHSGNLDGKGRARIAGIDPGECMICFPDMDGAEWARLQRA